MNDQTVLAGSRKKRRGAKKPVHQRLHNHIHTTHVTADAEDMETHRMKRRQISFQCRKTPRAPPEIPVRAEHRWRVRTTRLQCHGKNNIKKLVNYPYTPVSNDIYKKTGGASTEIPPVPGTLFSRLGRLVSQFNCATNLEMSSMSPEKFENAPSPKGYFFSILG